MRALVLLLLLALPTAGLGAPQAASKAAQLRLKPGAEGRLCLDCHTDFGEILKKASVHTPVRSADCAGCHSPHASDHGKLLAATGNAVCAACHPGVPPEKAKSVHQPVTEGCTKCHDPHATDFSPNLVKAPQELCTSCHTALGDSIAAARFKHRPIEKGGCVTCHDPHGSPAATLLKKDVPGLCLGCHKSGTPIFAKQHMGYPVEKARCTSCHDPHASSNASLLSDNVHPPVARKSCGQCHVPPTSAKPLALKGEGIGLCKMCHAEKIGAMMEKNRLHAAVVAGDGCLSCHSPHASRRPKLVKGNMVAVCGTCHSDTIRRQVNTPTKHPPVQKGQCTACHDPHGADAPLMFANQDEIALCGKCHDWQRHSSHPIGEKHTDPRNANLKVSCLSCHRAHGTEYKSMNPFPEPTALCTKCHEKYRR
jgi:DmsE family decaheme c-type cytochrome